MPLSIIKYYLKDVYMCVLSAAQLSRISLKLSILSAPLNIDPRSTSLP